ncbi:MAG: four helix bundle protein [Polyangiaceae bacterium]
MGTFNFQKLDCYIAAKGIAVAVHSANIRDAELRDQANRAAKSAFLNLSEGLPSLQSGIRKRHFALSRGSLCELAAALDLAVALGSVDADSARLISDQSERLTMMLHKL